MNTFVLIKHKTRSTLDSLSLSYDHLVLQSLAPPNSQIMTNISGEVE
jgi:hypothetical protein